MTTRKVYTVYFYSIISLFWWSMVDGLGQGDMKTKIPIHMYMYLDEKTFLIWRKKVLLFFCSLFWQMFWPLIIQLILYSIIQMKVDSHSWVAKLDSCI